MTREHPLVASLEGQWHKLLAVVLHKYKLGQVEITAEDILALPADSTVIAKGVGEKLIKVWVAGPEETERLVREEEAGEPT